MYKIKWSFSFFFLFYIGNMVQKFKVISLSWNFVPRLFWMCRIWCLINLPAVYSQRLFLSIIKEQLQPCFLSNLLCFCRPAILSRRLHPFFGFRYVYMYTASILVIHFFSGSVIMSQEHLKWLMCQGHYKKLSMVDSRKFEGYVHLRKAIVALLF